MFIQYHNVAVRSIAAVVPPHILNNLEYAATVSDKKYRRRILYTGIEERHTSLPEQRASDLASIAAEAVMKKLGWEPDSIRVLIFVTQTPDLYTPSTAMLIQSKLKMGQNLLAFDVNLGCSGYSSGLQIMAGILSQTKGRGLLLVGDCQHYMPGTEFESNSIMFGDSGTATAMEYDESAPSLLCHQMTDGSRFKCLCSTYHGFYMDGNAIVLFSLNEVVDSINEFHMHYGISQEEIDYYALHQAQKIIVEGIAQNCNMPSEKVLRAYQKYGNTSCGSIPVAICANVDKFRGPIRKLKIFTCGFGVGLAWSSTLIAVDSDNLLPLIESDYIYPLVI